MLRANMESRGCVRMSMPLKATGLRIETRAVACFRELYQAYQLVHDEYSQHGLCAPRNSGLRFYIRELLTSSSALVSMIDNVVVGTATGSLDSVAGLPSDPIFAEELQYLRNQGRKIAESTKFACRPHPQGSKRGLGKLSVIGTSILGGIYTWCCINQVDDWIITVHPRVSDFYMDMLGFEYIAGPRTCAHVSELPGVMLRLDLLALRNGEKLLFDEALPVFREPAPSQVKSFSQFKLSDEEAALLLLEEFELTSNLNPKDGWLTAANFPDIREHTDLLREHPFPHIGRAVGHSLMPALEPILGGERKTRQAKYNPKCFALRAMLAGLETVFQLRAARLGKKFDFEVDYDIPDSLIADSDLLGQIITELVANMLICGRPADKICVKLRLESLRDDEILIELNLIGPLDGIPEKISPKIAHLGGHGILLSKEQHYSSVTFHCPAVVFSRSLCNAANQRDFEGMMRFVSGRNENLNEGRGLRTLVVEDNPISRLIAKKLCLSLGHEVDVAVDGAQCIRKAKKNSYDLILMDIHMPLVDGLKATQILRSSGHQSVPIFAVTSFVMHGDRKRCLEMGMDGFLAKPLIPEDLKRVSDWAFGKKQTRAEAKCESETSFAELPFAQRVLA